MQVNFGARRVFSGIALSVALGLASVAAQAQTSPTGQVLSPGAPGARTGTGCSATDPNSTTSTNGTSAPNCLDAGPGFATPSTNTPAGDHARMVMSMVRVETVIPRPPVVLPEGDSFSVVGGVTLVRLRRPAVEACLATGRRISARASAATSTTCLGPKGDVLAYEECKAGSTEAAGCSVLTPADIAKQQVTTNVK